MMGSRGDGIGSLRNHTGTGDIRCNLGTRQMTADARLCALANLDFHCRTGIQVILFYAETAGCNLYDGVGTILVKVLMQTAFTGVVEGTHVPGSTCQRFMGVVADGAIGHSGEHDRHIQTQPRGQVRDDFAVFVTLNGGRLLTQIGTDFHWLTQRVNGRVGNLGCIDQDLIPVNRIVLRIAHGGQQGAAGFCLTVNLLNDLTGPVGIFTELVIGLGNLEGAGRTQGYTAMAADTLAFIRNHLFQVVIVMMYFFCTLSLAYPACNAAIRIAQHLKLGI